MTRFLYDSATEHLPDTTVYGPSKTRVKTEMTELQLLGLALLELPASRFARVPMNERLRSALDELQRITDHGARKRQAQFIGKLLRDADVEIFRSTIAEFQAGKEQAAAGYPDLAKWRDRLLTDDTALTAWFSTYPTGDTRQLRTLVRQARKEEAEALAESQHSGNPAQKGRYFRELFQYLRNTAAAANEAD